MSDKIKVIDALIDKADTILIGGAMAYTFKLAAGGKIGMSWPSPTWSILPPPPSKKLRKRASFLLPLDNLGTDSLDFGAAKICGSKIFEGNIDDGWEGIDIGPKTMELYSAEIAKAKTIL